MPNFLNGDVAPTNQALANAIQGKPDQLTTQNPDDSNPLLSWIKSRSGYNPVMSMIPGTPQWQAAGHAKNQQSMGQHVADLLGYVGMAFPGGSKLGNAMGRDAVMQNRGFGQAVMPPNTSIAGPFNNPKPMNPDSVIGKVDQLTQANESPSVEAHNHWLDNADLHPHTKEIIAENHNRVGDPDFMKAMEDFDAFVKSIDKESYPEPAAPEQPVNQSGMTQIGQANRWAQLDPDSLRMYTDQAAEHYQKRALAAMEQGDMKSFADLQRRSNAVTSLENAKEQLQNSLKELNTYRNVENKQHSERYADVLKRANHYQDIIDAAYKALDNAFGIHE